MVLPPSPALAHKQKKAAPIQAPAQNVRKSKKRPAPPPPPLNPPPPPLSLLAMDLDFLEIVATALSAAPSSPSTAAFVLICLAAAVLKNSGPMWVHPFSRLAVRIDKD